MNLWGIVLREIRHKRRRFLHASVAIIAGISVLVGVRMLARSSYSSLMEDLHDIGSGYLVIAIDANAVNVLRGEEAESLLPESIIPRIASLDPGALGDFDPRLYRRVTIQGRELVLTGVFRPNELKTKNDENIAATFLRNIAAGSEETGRSHEAHSDMGHSNSEDPIDQEGAGENSDAALPSSVTLRSREARRLERNMFQDLGSDEVIVGAAAASALNVKSGDTLTLFDMNLTVKEVLGSMGDRDDIRLFVHVRTAQSLLGLGPYISVVEVMGCCVDARSAPALKASIENSAGGVKVVTVEDVARTRMNAFALSKKIVVPLVFSLLLIGAAAVASHTMGSLRSRRREIGIFIALGALPTVAYKIFLAKAVILGAWSGIAGYVLGSLGAWLTGWLLLDYPVGFDARWLFFSVAGACAVTILSTLIPVLEASRREPALVTQEE